MRGKGRRMKELGKLGKREGKNEKEGGGGEEGED